MDGMARLTLCSPTCLISLPFKSPNAGNSPSSVPWPSTAGTTVSISFTVWFHNWLQNLPTMEQLDSSSIPRRQIQLPPYCARHVRTKGFRYSPISRAGHASSQPAGYDHDSEAHLMGVIRVLPESEIE